MFDDYERNPILDWPSKGDVVTRGKEGLHGIVSEVRPHTVLVHTSVLGREQIMEWAIHRLNYLTFKDLPSADVAQLPHAAQALARKRQRELDEAEALEAHKSHFKKALVDVADPDLVGRLSFSSDAIEEYRVHYAATNDPSSVRFLLKEHLKDGAARLPDSSKADVEDDEHLRIVTQSGLIGIVRLEGDLLVVSRVIVPSSKVTSIRSPRAKRRRKRRRAA